MRFVKLWLFLLLLMLLALVACAKATPTPTPTPTPAATPRATPAATPTATPTATPVATPTARKPQGDLVMAVSDIGAGNPGIPSRADSQGAYVMVHSNEYLLRRDTVGNLIPGLAEKWELSPDGSKLTFYLRQGVQFHDNWGELTAEDVKFSWEDAVKQGSINIGVGPLRNAERVEVVDRYTVVFYPKKGSAISMPFDLGLTPAPRLPIVSKKYVESVGLEKAAAKPMGTGSWKWVDYRAGDFIKLEAVENHYRQTPYFKTLTIKAVPEMATVVAMLQTGEVDIAPISVIFKAELEKVGVRIISYGGGYLAYAALGGLVLPTREPFDPKIPWVGDPKDPASQERALKVRKALDLAINKQEIVSTILAGLGQVAVAAAFFPGTAFPDPSWQPTPFNPDEARKLLAEAGYPNGFPVEMVLAPMSGRPWTPDVGEAVAMYWEKIGLKVSRRSAEYTAIRPMFVARNFGQRAFVYAGAPYGEPWMFYDAMFTTGGDANIGLEATWIDEMVKKIGSELDRDKRLPLQRELAKRFIDERLILPLGTMPPLLGVSKKVKDYPAPFGQLSLFNLEYVTPAK